MELRFEGEKVEGGCVLGLEGGCVAEASVVVVLWRPLLRFAVAAALLMGRGALLVGGSLLRRKSTRDSSLGRWVLRGSAVMNSSSSSS